MRIHIFISLIYYSHCRSSWWRHDSSVFRFCNTPRFPRPSRPLRTRHRQQLSIGTCLWPPSSAFKARVSGTKMPQTSTHIFSSCAFVAAYPVPLTQSGKFRLNPPSHKSSLFSLASLPSHTPAQKTNWCAAMADVPENIATPGVRLHTPDTVPVPEEYVRGNKHHLSSMDDYHRMYADSVADPSKFWGDYAQNNFFWKSWSPDNTPGSAPLIHSNFVPSTENGPVYTSFAAGATTNIAFNCLDRNVQAGLGSSTALIFEPNDLADDASRLSITYDDLLAKVVAFGKALRAAGVRSGDVVSIYMPMVPELHVAMLACARIGAVHSVVFGGFSADSLASRVRNADSQYIVTCDAVFRGKKLVELKKTVDAAIAIAASGEKPVKVNSVFVLERVGNQKAPVNMQSGVDIWWEDAVNTAGTAAMEDEIAWVDSEHPLFILYTSGSTGTPKGIQHSTGGYMVYAAITFKYAFNYQPGDVYFCTADCGWITGHSYGVYGPMLNGAAQVVFEGVPNYPDAGRLWEITDRYQVACLYTAPTAIRALKKSGDAFVTKYSRRSLKVLGTVGEPINPEAYMWYFDVVGNRRCPIVDTWWQTETGGHCLLPMPIPGLAMKPGCAMLPFFGIEAALLNEAGEELPGTASGYLVIKKPWPSTLRNVYGDQKRMEDVYFSRFPGYYMTGDGAHRDADGHFSLTGRVDDVLNVSGHRMGTAEVESALVLHPAVVEAAVVGVPHDIKGEDIYAYVTLAANHEPSEELRTSLKQHVRKEIGPIASPGVIHWAPALPKTRSGKIMRRILRIIAKKGKESSAEDFGDTSTLADESVVVQLVDAFGV